MKDRFKTEHYESRILRYRLLHAARTNNNLDMQILALRGVSISDVMDLAKYEPTTREKLNNIRFDLSIIHGLLYFLVNEKRICAYFLTGVAKYANVFYQMYFSEIADQVYRSERIEVDSIKNILLSISADYKRENQESENLLNQANFPIKNFKLYGNYNSLKKKDVYTLLKIFLLYDRAEAFLFSLAKNAVTPLELAAEILKDEMLTEVEKQQCLDKLMKLAWSREAALDEVIELSIKRETAFPDIYRQLLYFLKFDALEILNTFANYINQVYEISLKIVILQDCEKPTIEFQNKMNDKQNEMVSTFANRLGFAVNSHQLNPFAVTDFSNDLIAIVFSFMEKEDWLPFWYSGQQFKDFIMHLPDWNTNWQLVILDKQLAVLDNFLTQTNQDSNRPRGYFAGRFRKFGCKDACAFPTLVGSLGTMGYCSWLVNAANTQITNLASALNEIPTHLNATCAAWYRSLNHDCNAWAFGQPSPDECDSICSQLASLNGDNVGYGFALAGLILAGCYVAPRIIKRMAAGSERFYNYTCRDLSPEAAQQYALLVKEFAETDNNPFQYCAEQSYANSVRDIARKVLREKQPVHRELTAAAALVKASQTRRLSWQAEDGSVADEKKSVSEVKIDIVSAEPPRMG